MEKRQKMPCGNLMMKKKRKKKKEKDRVLHDKKWNLKLEDHNTPPKQTKSHTILGFAILKEDGTIKWGTLYKMFIA